jgi:HAD superfamily hydrolase (TIGR01509 family)
MTLRALIFDVDGTLAETEELHRLAFNETFHAFALPWHWDAKLYRELLRVGGGRERLIHYMRMFATGPADPAETAELARRLHAAKTPAYQRLLADAHFAPRPGIRRLITEARDEGIKLAIATTSAGGNVVALIRRLFGADASGWFAAVAAGEDAAAKKPDPAVFHVILERLRLPASDCIAIEDSAIGLRAATAAGLSVLIAPSSFTGDDDFTGALAVVRDLDHGEDGAPITLDRIRRWLKMREQ